MGSVSTRNFEGLALGPALPLLGSNSYSVLLVADNGGGTQQHLYALVVHGVVAPPPIAQWRQAFWGTTESVGLAADDADPDGDGISNALEYAFGGIPDAPSQIPLPEIAAVEGRLGLTLVRNVANTDLTITVQAADSVAGPWTDLAQSANGAPFTVLAAGATVSESGTGAHRIVEVRDAQVIGDPAHPRRFLRVQTTLP
jgi:hypothetical protein